MQASSERAALDMQAAHAGEAAQGTEEAAATAEQRVAEARRSGALEAEAARTKLRASAERAEGLERSQRPGALAEAWSARRDGIVVAKITVRRCGIIHHGQNLYMEWS